MTTVVIHYFCRIRRNVLVEPRIGKVIFPLPPPTTVVRSTFRHPQCGHSFCKPCIHRYRTAVKKEARCLTCIEPVALETAKPAGDDCFYPIPLPGDPTGSFSKRRPKSKGRAKIQRRKPGDDECGLQPKLAKQGTGRNSNGRKRAGKRQGKKSCGKLGNQRLSQAKDKKPRRARSGEIIDKPDADDGIRQMRANAGIFLQKCDQQPWDPVPHSAKTRAALELVQKWQKEALDDKIISGFPAGIRTYTVVRSSGTGADLRWQYSSSGFQCSAFWGGCFSKTVSGSFTCGARWDIASRRGAFRSSKRYLR